ncbi:MAG TPA: citrate synthase [Aliidongia sp.]|uniref:citrate synthase n=1 Tax=Aliidongia sp. TaxID=1914230 RepID=UPI002DDD2C6F|nr:citrate synthase [Aliidongia sp.]HEV2675441.1 citrate synthase [Aliidongia sp.]
MPTTDLIDASAAIALLGVGRATLYAYVSRGQIRSEPDPADPRRRLYHRADLEGLKLRKARGRRPDKVAEATLDWGLPVLESGISLIADGRLFYRGREATELARSATIEAAARWLWNCGETDPFDAPAPPLPGLWPAILPGLADLPPIERAQALLALAPPSLPTLRRTVVRLWPEAAALLRLTAAAALGCAPSAMPIHRMLADAWGLDAAGADRVRAALVLSADHELNVSTFTVRCIASTGAVLTASLQGGLAALSGPRHGGMTGRVEALFRALEQDGDVERLIAGRLARGETMPGFGHPLYPAGDPRGAALLALAEPDALTGGLVRAVVDLTGQYPSLDVGLVALARQLGLPAGSAAALFAIGRTAGWLAHALEQIGQDRLIRPRARYIGPVPA